MTDRRTTPANARVAHVSLRGVVEAPAYVTGDWVRVTGAVVDLMTAPRGGKRDRQVIYGERVLVLERRNRMAFAQTELSGFCGYIPEKFLGPDLLPTHWVSAPATHLYPAPSLTSPASMGLTLGSRLTITHNHPRFLETADGLFVPRKHLRTIGDWSLDAAGVAEQLLGTPYFWGGNSRSGIDCSGLVQMALNACGLFCPGDADLQMATLGHDVASLPYQRGDLFFWKGHVAIAVGHDWLIHANGFYAAVTFEPIQDCIARIDAQGEGPLLAVRRL